MLSAGSQVAGRYRIEGLLGEGGMGAVYRAIDTRLDRAVALKVIARGVNRERMGRFIQEAHTLARISDSHVVQVYDFDAGHQPPYLVMELVQGRSLSHILRHDGAQPRARVLDCAQQILSGLISAHAMGVIHRDIKPSNILLADGGTWKLLDFGLARDLDSPEDLTQSDCVVGTIHYVAPEVARGQPATPRSDLYSLGLTLVHMLTGRRPWGSRGAIDIISTVARSPQPSSGEQIPDLAPEMARWLDRLLAFRAEDRFADATAALRMLGHQSLPTSLSLPPSHAQSQATVVQARSTVQVGSVSQHRPTATPGTSSLSVRRPHGPGFMLQMLALIWLVASVGTIGAVWMISNEAYQEQLALLRARILVLAQAAAHSVNAEDLALAAQVRDRNHRAHQYIYEELRALRDIDPDIAYVYTVEPSGRPGIVRFIVDASEENDANHNGVIDANEELAAPGKEYATIDQAPRMEEGFTRPICEDSITEDQWGAVLSGYAPIFDAQGNPLALVGIDLRADAVHQLHERNQRRMLMVLAGSLITFAVAALFVGRRLNRPIATLRHALRAAARGNYHQQLPDIRFSDLAEINQGLNHLFAGLRERDRLRSSLERYVLGVLGHQHAQRSSQASDQQHSILLYGDCQGLVSDSVTGSDMELHGVLRALFGHGGTMRQLESHALVCSFSGEAPGQAEERALRAALAARAAVPLGRVRSVIVRGGTSSQELRTLVEASRALDTQILVTDDVFRVVHLMFLADALHDVQLSSGTLPLLWSVRSPVSA